MDEIYDNLENYNDVNVVDELRSENKELKLKLEYYAKTIETLQRDFDKVSKEFKSLEINYSSLLKTARAEIERKTQIIASLNVEKDMLVLESLKNGNKNLRSIRSWSYQKKGKDRILDDQLLEKDPSLNSKVGKQESFSSDSYNKRYKSNSKENLGQDASKGCNKNKDSTPNTINEQRQSIPKHCSIFSSDEEVLAQKQKKSSVDDNETINLHKSYNKNSTKHTERFRDEKRKKSQFYLQEENQYKSRNSNKHNEDSNKRRERYDSYRIRNHSSPGRYRKDNDYVIDSKHRRGRVLESPPQMRTPHYQKTRDFRTVYEKNYARDRQYERDKYPNKHKIEIDFPEPENKRSKPSYSEEDLDKYAFISCQSPDLLIDNEAPAEEPIIEIMGKADTILEDPRKKSNKYEIKSDNDNMTLSTTCGRNVDLKVIDIAAWENVSVPSALTQEPPEYNELFIHEVYKDIENLATNSTLESGEITDSITSLDFMKSNEKLNTDYKLCSKPAESDIHRDSVTNCIPTSETCGTESSEVLDSLTNEDVTKENIRNLEHKQSDVNLSNDYNIKGSDHASYPKLEHKISHDSEKIVNTLTETRGSESSDVLDSISNEDVNKYDMRDTVHKDDHKKNHSDVEMEESKHKSCPKPESNLSHDSENMCISTTEACGGESSEVLDSITNEDVTKYDMKNQEHNDLHNVIENKESKDKPCSRKDRNISFDSKKYRIPKVKPTFSDISQIQQCSEEQAISNVTEKDVRKLKTNIPKTSKSVCRDIVAVDLALSDDAGDHSEQLKKTTFPMQNFSKIKNYDTEKPANEKKIKRTKKTKKKSDSVDEIQMFSEDCPKVAKDNKNIEKFSELFGDTSSSLITPEDLKLDATELTNRVISNIPPDLEDAQNAMDLNVNDILSVQSSKCTDIDCAKTLTDMNKIDVEEKTENIDKQVEVVIDNIELKPCDLQNKNGVSDPCNPIDEDVNVVKTEIISTGFQPRCDTECDVLSPKNPQINCASSNEECYKKKLSALATSTPHKSAVKVNVENKDSCHDNEDSIDRPANILPNSQPEDIPDLRIHIVRRRRKVLKK